MSDIFLSYRRDDASGHAGRLFDRLTAHFGRNRVFRDVDSLTYGTNFHEAIREAVSASSSFVAVIGPEWLTVTGRDGNRRLDDPNDFVRLEIESALARGIPVIPVLVEEAEMPTEADLPRALVRLSHYNGLEVSDTRWDYDVGKLLETLERWTPRATSGPATGSSASGPSGPPGPPPAPRPSPTAPPALPSPSDGRGWLRIAIPAALAAVVVGLALFASGGDDEPSTPPVTQPPTAVTRPSSPPTTVPAAADTVVVPSVLRQPEAAALGTLRAAGVTPAAQRVCSGSVGAGLVRQTETSDGKVLSGGERVPRGARVVVKVSTGVPCS